MSLARSLAAACAAAVLCASLAAQSQVIQPAKAEKTTETRTLPLAAGATLKVKNVNGFIRVEAWDREEVQFTGEFKPSSKDEQVKVVLEVGKGSLDIRGEYPKHTGWGSYNGPQCQMTLKVPHRVVPTLESVNGEVALAGTQGAAVLTTVNGGISFNAKGAEEVEVKKHRVTATFPGSDQGIHLDTVNGAITLE